MNHAIVHNDKLFELIDRYSPEDAKAGTAMKAAMEKLDTSELIVPVIGLQNMGKSTLINAILGEDILPTETNETTCVPTEIVYGDKKSCKVFFKDGRSQPITYSKDVLAEYVDNAHNPANQKGVSRIVISFPADILKNGTVLVDLPGVGSLTKENEDTTMRYITNLCTAIFVIPTIPTIRQSEAAYIKAVWSQFPTAMFVQNMWNDVADQNVRDSAAYNKSILSKIAKEINNSFNGDEDHTLVNVYNAACGRIRGDSRMAEASGISTLLEKLSSLTQNWTDNMSRGMGNRMKNLFAATRAAIAAKKEEIGKSEAEIRKQREAVIAKFDATTAELNDKVNDILDFTSQQKKLFRGIAAELSKECADNITARIYPVIDSGITDGERLSRAFSDIQQSEIPAAVDKATMQFNRLKAEVCAMLDELDITASSAHISIAEMEFNKKHQLRWESGAAVILDLGGGIGGLFAGQAIGGAVGAALAGGVAAAGGAAGGAAAGGAIGAAAGPIGIAVGVVVGAAIAGIAGLIGHFGKKAVIRHKAKITKAQIAEPISEIQKELNDAIMKGFNDTKKAIENSLDNYMDMRREFFEKQKTELLNDIKPPESDAQLIADLRYLDEMEVKYEI